MRWHRRFIALGVVVLLVCGQSTVFACIFPPGKMPDFFLAIAIVLGVWRGAVGGAVGGFVVGFVQGAMQGIGVGAFVISRMLASFVAGFLRQEIFAEHWGMPSLCAVAATVAAEVAFAAMNPSLLAEAGALKGFAATVAVESGYNVLLVPLFWGLLKSEFLLAPSPTDIQKGS